jgi:hypothetical protein
MVSEVVGWLVRRREQLLVEGAQAVPAFSFAQMSIAAMAKQRVAAQAKRAIHQPLEEQ